MTGWLSTVVAAVAVLSGVGAAATWLTVGRQKGRVILLETQAADLRSEIADLDRRNTRLESRTAADQAMIQSLKDQVAALQLLKSGEESIMLLGRQMRDFRDYMTAEHRDIKVLLGDRR